MAMAMTKGGRIELENINHPGKLTLVDAAMHLAMKQAFLVVLPSGTPGLTAEELRQAVLAHLPKELYPNGAKAGWWTKAVQLDLEAKGVIVREKTVPLRLHKSSDSGCRRRAKPGAMTRT